METSKEENKTTPPKRKSFVFDKDALPGESKFKEEQLHIPSRIKMIRLSKSLSQDYVASKLGISQKAYSKIENSETRLNVDKLLRISDILEEPLNALIGDGQSPVLADFSNRTGGDNVIYQEKENEKLEALYKELLEAKEEIIRSKERELKMKDELIAMLRKAGK
jgi:transcriptional regulator with XRE-family HTH domain